METTLDSIRDINIYQPRDGYRFSVDALLLYSFVNVRTAEYIADIGAGAGIVGLLLAKKYISANVTLFEIQDSLAELAEKNIAMNSLKERVKVIKTDIREIRTAPFFQATVHTFDVAVSNPPFRKGSSGLINPDEGKAIARHEIMIDLQGLVDSAHYLLRPNGRLFLIYHPSRLTELIEILRKRRIEAKRLRFVHSDARSEARMVMVEAAKNRRQGLKVERPLFIYRENGEYSDEMQKIYGR